MATVPDTFRSLFARYANGVPTSFLQALAWNESRNKPDAVSPTGADGLFQIVRGTLQMFNNDTGRGYSEQDMYDPAKNTEVAVWLLNTIQDKYEREAPAVFDLPYVAAWQSRQFVELVVLGYTAGWESPQGVSGIARRMLAEGTDPDAVTLDGVLTAARLWYPRSKIYVDPAKKDANGYGPYMSDPKLAPHVIRVTNDYFNLRPNLGPVVASKGKRVSWFGWLLVIGGGAAALKYGRNGRRA